MIPVMSCCVCGCACREAQPFCSKCRDDASPLHLSHMGSQFASGNDFNLWIDQEGWKFITWQAQTLQCLAPTSGGSPGCSRQQEAGAHPVPPGWGRGHQCCSSIPFSLCTGSLLCDSQVLYRGLDFGLCCPTEAQYYHVSAYHHPLATINALGLDGACECDSILTAIRMTLAEMKFQGFPSLSGGFCPQPAAAELIEG